MFSYLLVQSIANFGNLWSIGFILGIPFLIWQFSLCYLKKEYSAEDVVKMLEKISDKAKAKCEKLDPKDSNYFNDYTSISNEIIVIQKCVKIIKGQLNE
jgi:hypothetical protein